MHSTLYFYVHIKYAIIPLSPPPEGKEKDPSCLLWLMPELKFMQTERGVVPLWLFAIGREQQGMELSHKARKDLPLVKKGNSLSLCLCRSLFTLFVAILHLLLFCFKAFSYFCNTTTHYHVFMILHGLMWLVLCAFKQNKVDRQPLTIQFLSFFFSFSFLENAAVGVTWSSF